MCVREVQEIFPVGAYLIKTIRYALQEIVEDVVCSTRMLPSSIVRMARKPNRTFGHPIRFGRLDGSTLPSGNVDIEPDAFFKASQSELRSLTRLQQSILQREVIMKITWILTRLKWWPDIYSIVQSSFAENGSSRMVQLSSGWVRRMAGAVLLLFTLQTRKRGCGLASPRSTATYTCNTADCPWKFLSWKGSPSLK